jgi:hypothetical protein
MALSYPLILPAPAARRMALTDGSQDGTMARLAIAKGMVCRETAPDSGGSWSGHSISCTRLMPDLPLETDFKKKPFPTPVASPWIVAEEGKDSPFEKAPAF